MVIAIKPKLVGKLIMGDIFMLHLEKRLEGIIKALVNFRINMEFAAAFIIMLGFKAMSVLKEGFFQ